MPARDIIVAGKNWGCGSAREQAVKYKARGVSAIIAKGFPDLLPCINEGLFAVVCPEAVDNIKNGEKIEIDFADCLIKAPEGVFTFTPYPDFVRGIVESGGLLPYTIKLLREQGAL